MKPQNRMYDEMLKAARSRLHGRKAEDIEAKTRILFEKEKSMFHFYSLGKEIWISYPEYETDSQITEWHFLTILHYMDMANGSEPQKDLITMGQLKNGLVRGGGFDRQFEQIISQILKKETMESFQK